MHPPMNPTFLSAPEPSAAIVKHLLVVGAELTRTPIAGLHAPETGDNNACTLPDRQAAIAARVDARITLVPTQLYKKQLFSQKIEN